MKNAFFHLLIVTFCLVFLTGCKIDGEEEVTILDDGSGDIRIHFILPYKAFSKTDATEVHSLLEQISARHTGLSLIENESCPYGNYCQALKLHISFVSVLDLERIVLSEKDYFENKGTTSNADEGSLALVRALLGNIDASIQPWGIDYHRQLDLSPLFEGKINNGAALGDAEFRYILNTPMNPDSHNADTLDESSGKLVWKIPLKKYFNKPFILQANYKRGGFLLLAIGSVTGVILIAWIYKRIRASRKLKCKESLRRPS